MINGDGDKKKKKKKKKDGLGMINGVGEKKKRVYKLTLPVITTFPFILLRDDYRRSKVGV